MPDPFEEERPMLPVLGEQWAVIDRWWTDVPIRREYVELHWRNGARVTVGYGPGPEEFVLFEPRGPAEEPAAVTPPPEEDRPGPDWRAIP